MKSLILRHCIACLLLLTLAWMPLQAARVDDLFQAEVDAAGRDSGARQAALRAALRQVLVRVTGSARTLRQAPAQALLRKPGRFVEQYRFQEIQDTEGGEKQLRLWVQFDSVALTREVRGAGLPYWGSERPDVLLWLAVDDRGQRYIVSEAADSQAAGAVGRAAAERGLPVTLPLMDLEDQREVQFTDVWGGFLGGLEAASQRYRPQVILAGRLDHSGAGGTWRGTWSLVGAGGQQSWSVRGSDLDAAVAQGLAEAAERLATQYAVAGSGASFRRLLVEGIESVEAYARVHRYLNSLTLVDDVQVVRVADGEVQFDLTLSAQERRLLQLITLGSVLQPVGDPPAWRFRLHR
ncbi:MAG: DUF2066 domain-containing protein [Gammaproteobacteria bacterium]|jgi:hypothetical protein